MDLVNSYSLTFNNKSVKYIFTEVFTLNYYLFLFCMTAAG